MKNILKDNYKKLGVLDSNFFKKLLYYNKVIYYNKILKDNYRNIKGVELEFKRN